LILAGVQRLSIHDDIRDLERRVELLAPAGRPEALEAVLAAGADAVYLGAKQFNMRRHRGDFNFTDDQLGRAVDVVHRLHRRVYVTVNAMLGEAELPAVRDLLGGLESLGVDAIIVQDAGTLQIARELGLKTPLHASTMMNVHHPAHARVLRECGVTRVITSRDISLQELGRIGREAGVEVECFVHGDMCVAQSGQCTMSGVLFGKSANRGECMKPCRWDYHLVRMDGDEVVATVSEGHLLAIKDLCLVQNIPDIIQAGICSLKIEGRMRDPAYLGRLVSLYREALDQYYASPPSFQMKVRAAEEVHRLRVRPSSTLTLLGGSSHRDHFDTTGRREPLFLSDGCAEAGLTGQTLPQGTVPANLVANAARTELAVCVSSLAGARAAMDAGARRIDWAAEVSRAAVETDSAGELAGLVAEARERGVAVGLRTPRVTTDREWAETRWLLRGPWALDCVLVHHLGVADLARSLRPGAAVIADHGFNLLNSAAARFLERRGVARATVSVEAGFEEFRELAEASPLPLEILAHGPVAGMVVDHCVIALHGSPGGRKDVCRGPCRHVGFALRDRAGEVRPVIADQYCRNHLLTSHDVGILPVLPRFLLDAVRSIRIEAQFYPPELTALITRAYRTRLNGLAAGDGILGWQRLWATIEAQSPRPLNLGAYARSITRTRSTAQVMKEHHHA
jgi:putative protease